MTVNDCIIIMVGSYSNQNAFDMISYEEIRIIEIKIWPYYEYNDYI